MNSTATIHTSSRRALDIDGMSGEACVQKVKGALNGVHGVTSQTVKVGSASFSADASAYNAARTAIGVAGFKSREGPAAPDAGDHDNQKTTPGTAVPAPAPGAAVMGERKTTSPDKPAAAPDAKPMAKPA